MVARQKQEKTLHVAPLLGLVDIDDQIVVDNEATAAGVADRISEAFARNAELYGSSIDVFSDSRMGACAGASTARRDCCGAIIPKPATPQVTKVATISSAWPRVSGSSTIIAPSTVRSIWPPRIIAKLSDEEK